MPGLRRWLNRVLPIVIVLASTVISSCVDANERVERPAGPLFEVNRDALAQSIATLRQAIAAGRNRTVQADNIALEAVLVAADDPVFNIEAGEPPRYDSFLGDLQPDRIRLYATDRIGLNYALDHLGELLGEHNMALPSGQFYSWADHEVRALHIVMRKVSEQRAIVLIDQARQARFNTLILHLSDAVRFDNDVIRYRDDALSKEAFLRVVKHARNQGLTIVPGVSLLTHQEHFFKNRYPQLMYNKSTYDPRDTETIALATRYLQEVIDTLQPDSLHIGHDEVAGLTDKTRKKWLRPDESALPPELFLQHVVDIQQFLAERNVETWMWGDMLIAHSEFPAMHAADFNGLAGYAVLRGELPPSIVVCDWHYYQRRGPFSTSAAFTAAGHPVLGTTWKSSRNIDAFSEYIADLPGARGMVASTWFHVQRQENEVVADIIATSGKRFWDAR